MFMIRKIIDRIIFYLRKEKYLTAIAAIMNGILTLNEMLIVISTIIDLLRTILFAKVVLIIAFY